MISSRYKDELQADLNLSDLEINKLSFQLSLVEKGSSEILTTPLAKSRTPEDIKKLFEHRFMSKIKDINCKPLTDLEESNLSKYGPRSLAKPWTDRKESLYKYFEPYKGENPKKLDGNMKPAPKYKNVFRPISVDSASKFIKPNTNSGLPYLVKKKDILQFVVNEFNKLVKLDIPCVLFTRTQELGKTRNVWGVSIVQALMSMCYFQPILAYFKQIGWRSSLNGPLAVDLKISKLIGYALLNNLSLVSIDFSSYDASLKPEIIRLAFEYLKQLFQTSYSPVIEELYNRFVNIRIVTPSGIWKGAHGVPSGDVFTLDVNSLCQRIVAEDSKVLIDDYLDITGDDGAYVISDESVNKLFDTFEKYGLSVNREKSFIAKDYLIYLQKLFHAKFMKDEFIGGIYPLSRALNRLVYQERFYNFEAKGIEGRDYYSIRAICILENCKYHPLFEDFVRFITELDKYNLAVSQNGISQYVQLMTDSNGAEGLLINQYGDDLKGIKSFQSFKLIKSFK